MYNVQHIMGAVLHRLRTNTSVFGEICGTLWNFTSGEKFPNLWYFMTDMTERNNYV